MLSCTVQRVFFVCSWHCFGAIVSGDVIYSIRNFNEKNRENLSKDIKELVGKSTNDLVTEVFTTQLRCMCRCIIRYKFRIKVSTVLVK